MLTPRGGGEGVGGPESHYAVGYLVGRVEVQGEQLLFEDLCGLRLLGIWKILGVENLFPVLGVLLVLYPEL
jgi:hypothetical protein